MGSFRYTLRKGSKKDECPSCHRKTFKPYIDSKDGKLAGSKYGVCDRINNCGYSEYPKYDKNDEWRHEKQPYVPPKPIDYVDSKIVLSTFVSFRTNVFISYLIRMFGIAEASELQSKYKIGTAKHGGTIFWQKDLNGRFRTAKVMYYNPNGKRSKERSSWFVHSKIRKDFNYQQCFFGLHLVDGKKPVALCESEKTAILMSVFRPEYTWIASGGSEMLSIQRLSELPRLDIVFPDGGQFEKWESKTKHFTGRKMDLSVERAISDGIIPAGSDILDLVLTQKEAQNG